MLAGALLGGCKHEHDHKGKTPLAEVNGQFLYREDLQAAAPAAASKDDSVLFAEHYIRNWVEDVLLFRKAEENIPSNERINRLVENYRRALIMHAYEEELVSQKLSREIGEAEIEAYHEAHKALFRTERPYVKGLFIKVPLHAGGIGNLRSWYRKNSRDAIEKIEKYSIGHAVNYDYFYDRWTPVADLAAKIPLPALASDPLYLDKNRNVEVRDTAFCYFLHTEEYLGEGKERPLDFARDEIKEILINLKRVEFIGGVKDELYRQAAEKGRINYYYLKSD